MVTREVLEKLRSKMLAAAHELYRDARGLMEGDYQETADVCIGEGRGLERAAEMLAATIADASK